MAALDAARDFSARARAAFGFDLDPGLVAAWLESHGKGHDLGLALACGLYHRVPGADACFERAVAPKVRGSLRKLGATDAEADEHLQQARTRLLVEDGGKRLFAYRGLGSFDAFVTTTAVRSFTDTRRRQKGATEDDELERLPAAVDLERALSRSGHAEHFAAAFKEALATLAARERALLKLNLVDGASIDALAPMYGVNRATVWRWLTAAKQSLHARTLQRLSQRTRLDGPELGALMASLESGFDVSLRRFVLEAAGEEEPA